MQFAAAKWFVPWHVHSVSTLTASLRLRSLKDTVPSGWSHSAVAARDLSTDCVDWLFSLSLHRIVIKMNICQNLQCSTLPRS